MPETNREETIERGERELEASKYTMFQWIDISPAPFSPGELNVLYASTPRRPRSFLEVFGVPDLNNELAKSLLSAHREETIQEGERDLEQAAFKFRPVVEADYVDLEYRVLAQLEVSEEKLQSLGISRKDVENLRKLL